MARYTLHNILSDITDADPETIFVEADDNTAPAQHSRGERKAAETSTALDEKFGYSRR